MGEPEEESVKMTILRPRRRQPPPRRGQDSPTGGIEQPRAQRKRLQSGTEHHATGLDTPGRLTGTTMTTISDGWLRRRGTDGAAATRRVCP